MISEIAVWLIVGLPLVAGLVTVSVIRLSGPLAWPFAGLLNVTSTAGAFVLSLAALQAVQANKSTGPTFEPHIWMVVGDVASGVGFEMTIGLLLDPLSAIMAALVSGVSTLVMIYSLGYMRKPSDDVEGVWSDYPRYFAYMSFFTAAMLGLVLAHNLVQAFVFWELVGLFSYLLIGFWFHRTAAAAAAKKAFIITRIGDFGFMLALMWLFSHRDQFHAQGLNPFEIPDINAAAPLLTASAATWAAIGLLAGAMGKSAQFPLNTWLPDAMEGPTPVSSLIHAATMVAAGVFLIARLYPLFEASAAVLNIIAIVGGLTAILAAALGLVAPDIKRVLAFSTISQLGYMFLALGVGAPVVALFHLFNHAFFKCLLFLSAGSVHHSVQTFDMRYMGGLRAWMPITYALTVLAGLSLAGIFPFAGFWSKDEVLGAAWRAGIDGDGSIIGLIVFALAIVAAAFTAFYVFRLIIMTFHGEFRGGIESLPMDQRTLEEAKAHVHKAESPLEMLLPMIVLGGFAVGSGFLFNSFWDLGPVPAHWFSHLFHQDSPELIVWIAFLSTAVAIGGIGLAVVKYGLKPMILGEMLKPRTGLARVLEQRYFMDYLYEILVVRRALQRGLFAASDWADRKIIDGTVDFIGWAGRNTGRSIAQLQTGQVQVYGIVVSVGAAALLWVFLVKG